MTLGDCLTIAEKSLAENGHEKHVKDGRHELHHAIREAAVAAVEDMTGRRVGAYLTDQHHNPDVAVIVFLFEPPSSLARTGARAAA